MFLQGWMQQVQLLVMFVWVVHLRFATREKFQSQHKMQNAGQIVQHIHKKSHWKYTGFFADMLNDLPSILYCNWNFSP